MTKMEIAVIASEKSSITQQDILLCMDTILETILEGLKKGERIAIQNFGTFYIQEYPERQSRNPKTGEIITVPPKKIIKFKISPSHKRLE